MFRSTIFSVKQSKKCFTGWPWQRRPFYPSKPRELHTQWHSMTSKETWNLINTVVRTSILAQFNSLVYKYTMMCQSNTTKLYYVY